MPVPFDYKYWKKKSNRFCGFRSSDLKALDAAFQSHQADQIDRAALKTAFYQWYDNNPKERLNSKRDAHAVITRLKSHVDQQDQAAPPRPRTPPPLAGATNFPPPAEFAPARAAPRPPAAGMAGVMAELHGNLGPVAEAIPDAALPENAVWDHSPTGQLWQFLIQSMNTRCGPTCVAMAAWIIKARPVDESVCSSAVSRVEEEQAQATPPIVMGAQGPADPAERQLARAQLNGTYMNALADVLTSLIQSDGLTAQFNEPADFRDHLISSLENGPVILHIRWTSNGGGHFVLAVEKTMAGVTILDPWYGLQNCPWSSIPATAGAAHSALYRAVPKHYCRTPPVPGEAAPEYTAEFSMAAISLLGH